MNATVRSHEPASASSLPSGRLESLDALRGFDMFLLVGFGAMLRALPALSDNAVFVQIEAQCHHPPWHGFRLWDLIFPLFIFLVGVSMPFSFEKRLKAPGGKWALYRHILVRTAVLAMLGLIFWGTPGGAHPTWGYYSVLYRIGISYLFSAVIVLNLRPTGQTVLAVGLLLVYGLVTRFVSVPGYGAGDFTEAGCLQTYLGEVVATTLSPNFRHVFSITLIPSITITVFGALAGQWLRSQRGPNAKTIGLLAVGVLFVSAGLVLNDWIPINKRMGSVSFSLLASGLSVLLLALFYWTIDVRGHRAWAVFFVVVGMNSITIYLGSRLIDFNQIAGIFIGGFVGSLGAAAALVTATTVAAIKWLLLYYLYIQRAFLKI